MISINKSPTALTRILHIFLVDNLILVVLQDRIFFLNQRYFKKNNQ